MLGSGVVALVACEDNAIREQSSHATFVVANETGAALLVHVDQQDSLTAVGIGQSVVVDDRRWGFTCDPVPVSQLECFQVYTSVDTQLAYQRTSNDPAPWTRIDLWRCRYQYDLVLYSTDLGAVPDSTRCN